MAISFDKYVLITSGVGGAAQVSNRELILRLDTINSLLPTESIVEFTDADQVGSFFGTTSEEFLQAQFYFGFISKLSTVPAKISFARWADVDTAPLIIGNSQAFSVATFTPIADGSFTLTLGPDTEVISGLNFTLDASLADVAATIETAVQAANIAPVFATATVVFNATESRFDLTGGATGDLAIALAVGGVGTEMLPLLGWVSPGVRLSNGVTAESITEFLAASTQLSNNFGSFSFVPILTEVQTTEAATWNDGENVKYIFTEKVLSADAQTYFDNLSGLSGVGLTLYDDTLVPSEYPWLLVSMIMAATPYQRRASVQNYMFQQATLTPSVTTTVLSDFFDSIRVNYYGETQSAGQGLSFYQRGFLMGLATDPIDMGVFANEIFLKDSISVNIINLLLALSAVSANASGLAQVLTSIQASIDAALFNGVISIGKVLNTTQIAFITSATDDPNAFLQIQNIGYWIDAVITEPTANNFVVDYTLLYSKNDVVRKVEGTHTLI